jgi:hypothetical protein
MWWSLGVERAVVEIADRFGQIEPPPEEDLR